jgi:preprotein translocase subunit SecA
MLKRFVQLFGGDPNKKTLDRYTSLVDEVNTLEAEYESLSDDELRAKTEAFRARLGQARRGLTDEEELHKAEQDALEDLLPEAFAAVREASKRTIGLRHYDVQIIGGAVLHQGRIAEMRTGEGKTLVATLPLYLNALTGRGVHLITVNDYLARRDARWMAPIYNLLGLSVGVLQMAARTENGKKAFIVELEKESPHEDQHQLRLVPRSEAYAADITYGTNSEFGFDYLRDNMTMRWEDRVQRGHYYAIVDEVDNVLVDEARTPLIISGPAQDEAEWYIRVAQVVRQLQNEDYEVNEKDRTVTLTEAGEAHIEELLGMALRDPERPEDVTLEQARMLGYLEQALRAQHLFRRNKDYLVQGGKVIIIDEFTGRLMPGRRWSDGLHQAVEAKEGARVQAENVTYATITIQNYFRMYEKLAGMSGTALTEAEEFNKIYKLEVSAIPTNLEYQAARATAGLVESEAKDPQGYKYSFYARRDDPQKHPVFYKRKDYPDVIYRTQEAKLRAVVREILQCFAQGRPALVGTTSVELSEKVSNRLRAEPVKRLAQVQLLRQAWFEKNNHEEDGRQVPELQFLNATLEELDVSAMRKLARELDIPFNPEEDSNLHRLASWLELEHEMTLRLATALQAGIAHQVLNARKHTEESQIIAGAGAFGAVTIATNMAGRGVDIKLGGELAEEINSAVARVLKRAGYPDPYDMSLEARRQALLRLDPEAYGIYSAEISFFQQHIEEMERVRSLGGLHVIGSERHEARRIDNQLRGRAARQGDPGSSRFYLSMEDDLMRLFGGQQADGLMQRMKIDDAMPLEVGLVSRIVEQSQTRVEGSNFDVRKHLLEYDDVLNTQRAKIYAQRNRIFQKDDLSEDVEDMLHSEINRRVPLALEDAEGPWKLLSWLEQIQPPIQIGTQFYPSYTLKLLADQVLNGKDLIESVMAINALLEVAGNALDAEKEHSQNSVNELLHQAEERLDSQLRERLDLIDTFFEGLQNADETDTRTPRHLADELASLARLPLRLTNDQQRQLRDDSESVKPLVEEQVEKAITIQSIGRLIGAVERRLEEPLELNPVKLAGLDADEVAEQVLGAVQSLFERRRDRYLGEQGAIRRDLENYLGSGAILSYNQIIQLLMAITQGAKASFDRKTHRRIQQHTVRFTYVYLAAHLIEKRNPEEITREALNHLERALEIFQKAWGVSEWNRMANIPLAELDLATQRRLRLALGEPSFEAQLDKPILAFADTERDIVIETLGRRRLTETYRQLLLSVISELWIEYLTQMEALRVGIGLEAYAQRDPLVQYKNRASALFQELLDNMRLGVVTRMFTYRPRDLTSSPPSGVRSETIQPEQTVTEAATEQETAPDKDDEDEEQGEEEIQLTPSGPNRLPSQGGSKKKRRRRRK